MARKTARHLQRTRYPTVLLEPTIAESLSQLAAQMQSTPESLFHRMVSETISTRAGLTNFSSYMSIESHGCRPRRTRGTTPLVLDPVTFSLFLYLCCRMGMGTDLVAVGALLVSYYAARNVVIQ